MDQRPDLGRSMDELINSVLRSSPPRSTSGEVSGDWKLGVSCSGGGIRSAAFTLGALQVLAERGILAEATHISAVSGANYVVSAMYITAAESDVGSIGAGEVPWSAGSPEEARLRSHTDYLAPGLAGRVWLSANLLYGSAMNYVPIALGFFLAGRVAGWAAAWGSPSLRAENRIGDLPDMWVPAALWAGLLAILLGTVLGVRLAEAGRVNDGGTRPSGRTGDRLELGPFSIPRPRGRELSRWAAMVVGGLAGLGTAIPLMILGTRHLAFSLSALVGRGDAALGRPQSSLPKGHVVYASLLGIVMALLGVGALAVVISRRRAGSRFIPPLATLAGYGLLLVPFAGSLSYGASEGLVRWSSLALPAAAAVVLFGFGCFVHNAHYSMHLFYRERLAWAFAVRRALNLEDGIGFVARRVPYDQPLDFQSTVALARAKIPDLPEPVVCAAANLTDRVVPRGRNVASFAFGTELCGSADVGVVETTALAKELSNRVTPLTYPTLMAVSGAAISPVMGRLTQSSLRLLMALLNVRLGIWIPNLSERSWRKRKAEDAKRQAQLAGSRFAWGWRVLWRLVDGWREPGALYVLKEGLGRLDRRSRYLYITDGGHWENLGLVELVRTGCRDVICIDASTDSFGGLAALGQAVSLLRTELNIELHIDASALESEEGGLSDDCVAIGRLVDASGSVVGRVTVIRAAVTKASSIDLREFRRREPRFPSHSTADQFYRDDRFEAYRSLGRASATTALQRRDVDRLSHLGAVPPRPEQVGVDVS